jgi:hypothetical protein
MPERGMLDEFGSIKSRHRNCVAALTEMEAVPSPELGQHNEDIYGGWLGLLSGAIADLGQSGVT